MPTLPWTYLENCSETGLQNFMLKQLEEAADLRKIISAESEKLSMHLANAEVARLLIQHREELARMADLRQHTLDFGRLRRSA